MQDDEPRLVRVGDVSVRIRANMNSREVATGAGLPLQTTDDLRPNVLLVKTLGLVLRGAGDVGLKVIPVLAGARVEIRRTVTELRECGVEVAGNIPRDRSTKEHPLRLQPLVGRADCRCGAEEDGAREPLSQRPLAKERL